MSDPPSRTHPVPVDDFQRIALLDVIRGIAVLGILLVNIPFMAMAGALAQPVGHFIGGETWLDQLSFGLTFLFADTKFLTIFSVLFGAGLALMSEKSRVNRAPFGRIYCRRLIALLAIGTVHVTLFWFGDILILYSALGFVAMAFRNCKPKTLLASAMALLLLNGLLWLGLGMLDPEWLGIYDEANTKQLEQRNEYRATFRDGSFADIVALRWGIYVWAGIEMLFGLGMRTLGLFLLGMYVIRSGGVNTFGMNRPRLIRTTIVGLGVGMALQAASLVADYDLDSAMLRITYFGGLYFGGLLVALAYLSTFTLWLHTNLWQSLRVRFAAAGRMALTNYLAHSCITSLLCNFCGLYDQLNRSMLLLIVLAIYALQLWLSPLWLRSFRYGPVEWLWRMATYLRVVPIRR